MISSDFVRYRLIWRDGTSFGSTLTGRLQRLVLHQLHADAARSVQDLMSLGSIGNSAREARERSIVERVRKDRRRADYRRIVGHENFWKPEEDEVVPATVEAICMFSGAKALLPLSQDHRLVDVLSKPTWAFSRFLADVEERRKDFPFVRRREEMTFADGALVYVGHACVTWTFQGTRFWIDPFFRPKNPRYSRSYQPLSPLDFPESPHVVLLTHSHPDHFDPGSLMHFPEDTRFFVPEIAHETPLAVNLRLRLAQLGFRLVRSLGWEEDVHVNGCRIKALPFYGEQPLDHRPEVMLRAFNAGNTYLVDLGEFGKALFLADSGADPRGDSLGFAQLVREKHGRVDLLFSNHRRWRLKPPSFLGTSVPQYLCCVPNELLDREQEIMLSPERLARAAAILGARLVIPYAMGGAHWYREIGLGSDYLRPEKSAHFESHPFELKKYEKANDWRLRLLLPGQSLSRQGRPRMVPGMRLSSSRPKSVLKSKQRSSLAVSGTLKMEELEDLKALLGIQEGSFFIAAPGFCEIYLNLQGRTDQFHLLVEQYFEGKPLIRVLHGRPWTSAPFFPITPQGAKSPWFKLFQRLHSRLFTAAPDANEMTNVLREIRHSAPFHEVSMDLLSAVSRELLGIELVEGRAGDGVRRIEAATRKAKPSRILLATAPEIPAALKGRESVRFSDPVEYARALMLLKLIHNGYLTGVAWRRPEFQSLDESTWVRRILEPTPGGDKVRDHRGGIEAKAKAQRKSIQRLP